MPEEKRNCINLLGYGNSCKFIMGMRRKPWRQLQFQGYTFTDTAFGCGWDSSQLQSKFQGSFTVFGGGGFSDYINATTNEALQNDFTAAMERIYPGSVAAATGRNLKYCWAGNPLSKGGYSSMKKGQWSTLAGWEALPLGNLYFAGEQVSLEFQGYMNGAASTGRQAAEAILAKIKAKTRKVNMKCLDCGFEGKFEDQTVITDSSIELKEWIELDGRECGEVKQNLETVEQQVCPNCRIVYQFNVC